ncbi:MAG: substrate-binding domain-containing protein [Bacteroidaceae bacterium]|nr:substrate-binding domain-containing protein [Bacteroidaceae bacterium]
MCKYSYLLIIPLLCLLACSRQPASFRIGVSQCSEDIWRDKLNSELRMAAYAHEGVDLLFASADDSDERQVQQIDSFLDVGIDLLVVAPNQVGTISPAIDRAYDRGVPVIVYERKTDSRNFTAYMGADNRLMGRQMGEFVCQRMKNRARVLEVMGLNGSSPAIERHEGFAEVLAQHPEMVLVDALQGDWTEDSGYEAVMNYKGDLSQIDVVFGQNDRMALGARRAFIEKLGSDERVKSGRTLFCGIDGLTGEQGGIALVRDSILEASYIYPTHGDEVLDLALAILEGKPFPAETPLQGALVTRQNANVLLLQAKETDRQTQQVDRLHALADNYFARLNQQRLLTLLAFGVVALLLVAIFLFYLYYRGRVGLQRERVLNNLWNIEPNLSSAVASQAEVNTGSQEGDEGALEENPPSAQAEQGTGDEAAEAELSDASASAFISRFRGFVESRMTNSELSIEDLASDMNLSRVQLYRKVKAITGSSPVELLRTARLNRGYQLLLTTDKTVSEVAYAVGFSAPAYFTKCFKDEFGMVPGDVRK